MAAWCAWVSNIEVLVNLDGEQNKMLWENHCVVCLVWQLCLCEIDYSETWISKIL
jgi:hypothetical protein